MKKPIKVMLPILIIILFSNVFTFTNVTVEGSFIFDNINAFENGDGKTEYWALLIGVDFEEQGYGFSFLPIDEDIYTMKNILLISDQFQEEHIKIITNKNATKLNIINGFRWLDKKEDADDICFIYYTGHGNYLNLNFKKLGLKIPIDLPPFDEKDHCDEYITTWWSGINPLSIITDDLYNRLLNRLDSRSVCVFFDSCFSGGMNDNNSKNMINPIDIKNKWEKEFVDEISEKNRVVLMSTRENESGVSVGDISFTTYFCEGLQGFADSNDDKLISAEEAFYYAKPKWLKLIGSNSGTPSIEDDFIDELVLTKAQFPPTRPAVNISNIIGNTNTFFKINCSSNDKEENKIKYVLKIEDEYKQNVTFQDSDYIKSGQIYCFSKSFDDEGIYIINAKSIDESGATVIPKVFDDGFSKQQYVLVDNESEIVDQFQLSSEESHLNIKRHAQSFKPNSSTLSKVKIKMRIGQDYEEKMNDYQLYPVNISIRKNLTGKILTELSLRPYLDLKNCTKLSNWIEFDFPDISTECNETYYIIMECDYSSMSIFYEYFNADSLRYDCDIYPRGELYYINDDGDLIEQNSDLAFITYI